MNSQTDLMSNEQFLQNSRDFVFDNGYEIIGNSKFDIAVPRNTPDLLKKWLIATQITYDIGNKSIDYTIKRYSDTFNLTKKLSLSHSLLNEIISFIREKSDFIINKRLKLKNLPDQFGLFAASAAMIRLKVSFKSAVFLCEQGLSFETCSISKLILEQISWAFAIHTLIDDELYKVTPVQSISVFKKVVPYVGKLYGELNKYAHIDTSKIHLLVDFKQDDGFIILKSAKLSLQAAHLLLGVLDSYGICMEIIYKNWFDEFHFINITDNGYILKDNRESFLKYLYFFSEIDKVNKIES